MLRRFRLLAHSSSNLKSKATVRREDNFEWIGGQPKVHRYLGDNLAKYCPVIR
jgi:hypothetical protein